MPLARAPFMTYCPPKVEVCGIATIHLMPLQKTAVTARRGSEAAHLRLLTGAPLSLADGQEYTCAADARKWRRGLCERHTRRQRSL
jgi:hypothetical protein